MKRIFSKPWADYELLDAGNNRKLERWGDVITIRPERNAYFSPVFSQKEWKEKASFEFMENSAHKGSWNNIKTNIPRKWHINYKKLSFNLELTKFKHLGIFPEQQKNWDYINKHLQANDRF